jgi:hypothetical protein
MNDGRGTDVSGSEQDDGRPRTSLEYWYLCERFTVVQAALLIAGHDPSNSFADIERWSYDARPSGYEAAKHALLYALESDPFFGRIVRVKPAIQQGAETSKDPIDPEKSVVWSNSVKSWLSEQGIKTGFFFSKARGKLKSDIPDYLDPENSRYAPKLAAAIKAWRAVGEQPTTNGKSAKHGLT